MGHRRAIIYRTAGGAEPFAEYVDSLRDRRAATKIKARVARASRGNLGDYRSIGHGAIELRVHFGPGYRIYVGLHGQDLMVLLCSGDKSSQTQDIIRALEFWNDFRGSA